MAGALRYPYTSQIEVTTTLASIRDFCLSFFFVWDLGKYLLSIKYQGESIISKGRYFMYNTYMLVIVADAFPAYTAHIESPQVPKRDIRSNAFSFLQIYRSHTGHYS